MFYLCFKKQYVIFLFSVGINIGLYGHLWMTIDDKETTLKKLGLTLAMIMSVGFAAIPAQAGDSVVAGDIGIYSQYMWRGMQASAGTSVQGDYGLDIGGGLSANVWFAAPLGNTATGGNQTEFDYTIDYSGEAGGMSYSVGAIAYTYLNAAAGNATEVYAGVGWSCICDLLLCSGWILEERCLFRCGSISIIGWI